MMQDASGDGSDQKSESPQRQGGPNADDANRQSTSPDKLPRSASRGSNNQGNAPKSRATTDEKGKDGGHQLANPNGQDNMFDDGEMGNIGDLDGVEGDPAFMGSEPDKHQFLDNLDDEIGMNDDEDDGQDMGVVNQSN